MHTLGPAEHYEGYEAPLCSLGLYRYTLTALISPYRYTLSDSDIVSLSLVVNKA